MQFSRAAPAKARAKRGPSSHPSAPICQRRLRDEPGHQGGGDGREQDRESAASWRAPGGAGAHVRSCTPPSPGSRRSAVRLLGRSRRASAIIGGRPALEAAGVGFVGRKGVSLRHNRAARPATAARPPSTTPDPPPRWPARPSGKPRIAGRSSNSGARLPSRNNCSVAREGSAVQRCAGPCHAGEQPG